MMKKEKFSFKKYIFPVIASVVVFALMVLLIVVTRKPEDAEAASSVTIGGKTYSADGNHMIILEVVPDESYDVLGSLVADNQGIIQWTKIVSGQPKEKDKFITYAQDYAINYLRSIDSTLGGKIAKAYFKNTLTNDLYSFGDFYQTTTAEKINYDLGNLQLVFYTVDSNGNPVDLIKDSSTNKPIRDIFSYSIFDSTKMNGALEIKYVKASEVTIADIDSAAMVYFSLFNNYYVLEMYKKMYNKTASNISNWTKGTYDLKANVALHLYMENITASKAVVYCATEKSVLTTNIGKICMLMDAIDGDYFVRDFAYNYVGNTNRMYEGQRGWIDVSNDTLKLFIEKSTHDNKTNYELTFGATMFSDCNYGYAPEGEYKGANGTYSYPRYNGTEDGVQQTLRKASLSRKNPNALVQELESNIGNIDDYKDGNYKGTYYQDARKALGVEDDAEFRYSQAIRYILGDFDTSNISTIKVLEVEPAGYYRYTGTMEDQKNIRRWFSLSTETNSAGDKFVVPYNIVIDHCSTNALIAKNVDLAAEYDLIIMGAYGKDKFNTSDSQTPFDTSILGNVFSKGSSWISGKGSDVTDAKLNGNDITDKVYNKLYDYTLRGMPIVFDKSLYFGDTKVTGDDTNMYKLRMDDLITKILADKGTNGNLTYTDVSAQGEQKVSIRLKFIKKPDEVISSTYTNYNGKLEKPVVYSVEGLDGTTKVDDVDGNIKVTFRGSEALPTGNYRIKIYIDRNQDGIFADDVKSDKKELLYYDETHGRGSNDEYYGKLYTSNGTTAFETYVLLPAASRGYFAWKVEIVKITGTDFASVDKVKYGAKSVNEGGFAIKGNETTVKVLQINADDGTLKLEGGLFAKYFNKASNVTGLNLSVNRMSFDQINSVSDVEKEFSKYSMIVLGMNDSYGKYANLNDSVIDALQKYINAGNAVLFTHDTMSYTDSNQNYVKTYNSLTKFTKGFLPLIGMKYSVDGDGNVNTNFTDALHYKLVGKSAGHFPYLHLSKGDYEKTDGKTINTNKISKLNDGQITEFPYAIASDIGVATTHSQYFALDLENHYANNTAASSHTLYNADGSMASQPVVWYTLNSGSEDSKGYYDYNGQDAMSNYYIYSFGNVTYSTAGHSEISGEAETQLFVNTFTRSLLSGNNNPEVEYTDDGSKFDANTTDYKNYNKTEFDKLARTKLSFKFRIIDGDLISNSDSISDAFMYIYNADSSRTDAMYDSSKDIYLGKINETTLADGTKTISLTGSSSSVIVGKEYSVENFWDVLTELNGTLTQKIDIANLMSRMKSGDLKIGILATDSNDGKGYAILTIECKTLFDLD